MTWKPDLRWAVYAVVAAVAVFGFVVSYSHIYDLGRAHAQYGTAARLLPLSVDGLIVAATLVLFIQGQGARPDTRLARWMPRGTLWPAIGATVAANVAYGLPHGWLSAVISGWPGAAFVAAVEIGIVAVRTVAGKAADHMPDSIPFAGQGAVPANVHEAAKAAHAASVAGGNPLGESQLASRFGIPRSQARKIVRPPERGQGGTSPAPALAAPERGRGVPASPPLGVPATQNGQAPGG